LHGKIDGFVPKDLLLEVMDRSKGGTFKKGRVLTERTAHLEANEARNLSDLLNMVLSKFELWGLIELEDKLNGLWTLTNLGRRVYTRLDLERLSSPPD